MKYDYFEYKKALAVLSQLKNDIDDTEFGRYSLAVSAFDDPDSRDQCFNPMSALSDVNSFKDSEVFSLIKAEFSVDREKQFFSFVMGQEECIVKNLPDFGTAEKNSESAWEKALANFIQKIRFVIDHNLPFQ